MSLQVVTGNVSDDLGCKVNLQIELRDRSCFVCLDRSLILMTSTLGVNMCVPAMIILYGTFVFCIVQNIGAFITSNYN